MLPPLHLWFLNLPLLTLNLLSLCLVVALPCAPTPQLSAVALIANQSFLLLAL